MYNIINGDAYSLLKTIKDNSVNLILLDPPYNISKYSTGNIYFKNRSMINNDIAKWDEINFDPIRLVQDFKRILKPDGNIFAFCSYHQIGLWHKAFDTEYDTFQFMVWHKTNPTPKIYKNGFLNSCELIVCMWNKGHKWNFTTQDKMHNFFETSVCSPPERLQNPKHPTQKPLSILKHIIELTTDEGDVVLDPFMGVGSTGVAAIMNNRNFLGFEIDPIYFNATKCRLQTINDKDRL